MGKVPDVPEKYDLMSLIMINLGSENENYSGLIRMLDLLLNKYTKAEKSREAENLLKNDYNITLRSYNKEADDMCNLSQGMVYIITINLWVHSVQFQRIRIKSPYSDKF